MTEYEPVGTYRLAILGRQVTLHGTKADAAVLEAAPDLLAAAKAVEEPGRLVCSLNGTSDPQGIQEMREEIQKLRVALRALRAAVKKAEGG